MSGQVSSQVKIRVGNVWLLAVVRNLRQATRSEEHSGIVAEVDFMGEGDTEKLTGNIFGFRRGVTRYPMPGALAFVATRGDLKQIYASDGRPNIGIGTVHPRRDLYRQFSGQTFRTAGIDRHRQIDLGCADPAPDLRTRAAGPHRDDRSARRIHFGVPRQRPSARCVELADAVLADEL
jgi:hypothetical protein